MKFLGGLAKMLTLTLAVTVLAAVAFVWWASGGADIAVDGPGERWVTDAPAAPTATLPAPTTVRVMSFNIGYGRGPAGDDSGPWSPEHIRRHLDGIAAQIASAGVDVVALQEVDLNAARSHHIHQGRYLADILGMHGGCVTTWDKNYVPFPYWPPSKHYGAMRSGQCVLSRWPVSEVQRYALPQPAEAAFYWNWFYLDRAIQQAVIPLSGGALHVYNVHFEAFFASNRSAHMDRLEALATADNGAAVLIAGDFNALPPGATTTRGFPDEPETDYSDDTMARAKALPGLADVLAFGDEATFVLDGVPGSERRLDYVLYPTSWARVEAARVLSDAPRWSDHLPIVAELTLLSAPAPSTPH